ncbi:uncharacterized protein SOCEGT47_081130 [Sorangium cellulosum]|uniref:Secreted protein n=1 Tax=Sorangium cellulosum TaxID=56 RepID=A0A4P2QDN0_SORCE|nr:hypothetical protein [Sorangium cellulosum]AUX27521.1 uncharacterized protein SOCEGT47_081130 [Sorangium cellulosum]
MIRFNRIVGFFVASMAATAIAGCTAQVEDDAVPEDVAQAEQAFDVVTCGIDPPTATFVGGIDYLSNRSYNDCYKGLILDVTNYETGFTPKPPGNSYLLTKVTWADAYPGNEAACESLWMEAYLYKEVNGVMVHQQTETRHGAWTDLFGCLVGYPTISFTGLDAGAKYRVAATAREGSSLRKMHVKTEWSYYP